MHRCYRLLAIAVACGLAGCGQQDDGGPAGADAALPDAPVADTAPHDAAGAGLDTGAATDTGPDVKQPDTGPDVAAPVDAGPTGCSGAQAFEDADLCNGRFFCDKALSPPTCRIDPSTVVQCDTAGDTICLQTACAPASGKCQALPANGGAACVDDDPCTVDSKCVSGACKAGKASWCDCKKQSDCAAFEDGNPCTGTLYCQLTHFPYRCLVNPSTVVHCGGSGDTVCAKNACLKSTGKCAMVPATDGTPCDDGDKATVGQCRADKDCDPLEDGDLCNGTLFCDKGAKGCVTNPATVISCPTAHDTGCTKNLCNPATGGCALQPVKNGTACKDADACTANDLCIAGACKPGGKFICACKTDADCSAYDDGNSCNGGYFCDGRDGAAARPARRRGAARDQGGGPGDGDDGRLRRWRRLHRG